VSLLEITPSAEWEPRPTQYRLSEITRVNFGGDYEGALYMVGGEPATGANPQSGANGRQPFRSVRTRASAAAASRRSL
jgi:hypothetical protein